MLLAVGRFPLSVEPTTLVVMVALMPKVGNGKAFLRNRSETKFGSISDGLSNTVAFGENRGGFSGTAPDLLPATFGWLSAPTIPASSSWLLGEDNYYEFSSNHTGVCNFVIGDGAVRSVTTSLDGQVCGLLAQGTV